MVKDRKKAKLTESERAPQDNADHSDDKLEESIKKLQDAQDDLEKVNERASDEVLEIEQKYNEIRRPVYLKRSEIIKTIPDFWLTAFLSHPALGYLLSDKDKKIFNYLKSLEVEDFKDVKSGHAIRFNFGENPYFEDTVLTKTFTFFDDGTNKISSTTIKWKEGMGVHGVKHKKKGNKQTHVEYSFFSWFSDSEQKMAELQDDVAEIIKEDLWPNPLKYFNNETDDEDSEGDEELKRKNGDDDDDDDGEEDTKGDS